MGTQIMREEFGCKIIGLLVEMEGMQEGKNQEWLLPWVILKMKRW